MAQRRGKQSEPPHDRAAELLEETGDEAGSEARGRGADPPDRGERPDDLAGRPPPGPAPLKGAVPEWVRRAFSAGLSGFFLTEEAFRKALGDTLPKDWADFAADQSSRARAEFLERLSYEIGRALENLDYATVLAQLLEGRTLEVSASIRLREEDGRKRRPHLRVDVSRKDEE